MGEARNRTIIRTSVVGIIVNVALAAFKAFVGLASNSVAIVMDAVNNLTDALSSIITIVGTRLASRAPDRKHPMGHGRIEYLAATIISVIVLYAGLSSLVESIRAILSPTVPAYDATALAIVAVAVVAKIALGLYVRRVGKDVSSDALVASGSDALFDAVISASTLVAALIFLGTGVSLEAWLGAAISAFIIKSGLEMLRGTLSEILGERIDPETAAAVRRSVAEFPEVSGAYDLVIHDYGPNFLVGSVHIEVPDSMSARELDKLERRIVQKTFRDTGVFMTGISIYAHNTGDTEAARMEQAVREAVREMPDVLQTHGFYVEQDPKRLRFDCVLSFDAKDPQAVIEEVANTARRLCPGYEVSVALDHDITDL